MSRSKVTMLQLCRLVFVLNTVPLNAFKIYPYQNGNISADELVNNSSLGENVTSTTVYYDDYGSDKQDLNFTNITFYDAVASPMYMIYTPSLVTLGISGNVLSIYVFYKSKLRSQSMSQYLTALAVSDSVFLGQLLPPWLSTMQINGLFHQEGYCKGFVYVSYVTCCLSSWLVIAFTVERFVAVQYPLQRPSVCTMRRARYIIIALALGAMLTNLPVIYFAGSGGEICNIEKDMLDQAAKFNWLDTTVTFTIPLLLIIILNSWIAIIVCKLEKERLQLMQQELLIISIWQQSAQDTEFLYRRSQQRITNMLLMVSTVFVIFNCPAYTLRVCGYTYDMTHYLYLTFAQQLFLRPKIRYKLVDSSDMDDKWMTAQTVATMLFNANFGINFFLYCLTGQNFRRALQQTVPCCGWLARKASAILNRSNNNHARALSITTSAASTGTDPTCIEMRPVETIIRRRYQRTGNNMLRWTFDNADQHRAATVTELSTG